MKANRGTTPGERGTVYLLHISDPLHHAAHYMGWARSRYLNERVEAHLDGRGSPLIAAALAAGRTVDLVATWPRKTRDQERVMKDQKNARRLCPRCLGEYNLGARDRMRELRARRREVAREELR